MLRHSHHNLSGRLRRDSGSHTADSDRGNVRAGAQVSASYGNSVAASMRAHRWGNGGNRTSYNETHTH